jgi:hypothetical protein
MIDVLAVRGVSPIAPWGGYRFFVGMRRFLVGYILILTRISALTAACVIAPRSVQSMPSTSQLSLGPERFERS